MFEQIWTGYYYGPYSHPVRTRRTKLWDFHVPPEPLSGGRTPLRQSYLTLGIRSTEPNPLVSDPSAAARRKEH
jgi:hypothetical protein